MPNRREMIKRLSALPLVGGFFGTQALATATSELVARDYFKELGVRTFINAAGTYTALTGSLMHKEVVDAINFASKQYVKLDDLQDKVGERIAELLGCEAAMVTAGAASAISLGTAGVLTGMDQKKAAMIPTDLSGMKTEVILQTSHNIGYAHAIRNCGVKLVFVETRADLEKAINKETAMMWFFNGNNFVGKIQHEEWLEVGKKYGIPTFNDCAADVPPVENLWKYTEMGYDLVCFSGGKGIRGPQSAGLLLGKKDLIAAARLSSPPRGDTVCRTNKVNKEEILGMMIALESYLERDHEADWKLWDGQVKLIAEKVGAIDGVEAEIHIPPIANHVPSLRFRWDQDKVKTTPDEVREALRKGHPSIETVGGRESVDITTWMMNPGEERIVASRLHEILQSAAI